MQPNMYSNIPIYNSLDICSLHLNIQESHIHSQATEEKV